MGPSPPARQRGGQAGPRGAALPIGVIGHTAEEQDPREAWPPGLVPQIVGRRGKNSSVVSGRPEFQIQLPLQALPWFLCL